MSTVPCFLPDWNEAAGCFHRKLDPNQRLLVVHDGIGGKADVSTVKETVKTAIDAAVINADDATY